MSVNYFQHTVCIRTVKPDFRNIIVELGCVILNQFMPCDGSIIAASCRLVRQGRKIGVASALAKANLYPLTAQYPPCKLINAIIMDGVYHGDKVFMRDEVADAVAAAGDPPAAGLEDIHVGLDVFFDVLRRA